MPTGDNNYSLMDAFQNNNYQGIQGGSGGLSGAAIRRSYGRGTGGRRIGVAPLGRGSRQKHF
jgi:hypothetical protein